MVAQPALLEPAPRPFAAVTLRRAEAALALEAICPWIRSIGLVAVAVVSFADWSLMWITFAATNENKHRRAAGKDQSAMPFSRSDQTAIGAVST